MIDSLVSMTENVSTMPQAIAVVGVAISCAIIIGVFVYCFFK